MSACISPSESRLALRLVELTQEGLPLLEDPWGWLAEQLGLSVESTLDLLKRLQADGAIRRIAAVPNHYRLGYRHNGMTVWDVADADLPRLGALLGAQPFVSHCYRRPRRPGWRYNLFAMVHGRSREEIDSYRDHLRYLLGDACAADDMLVSSRILKKTGLRLAPVGAKLARETGASVSERPHQLYRGQALLPQ
ncbi:siroheme decarboxylase subunit beta [Pseudomonas citrulli]|uniref:siroheme decarboxylase n=1 Tax=Pseudomonas citrulli TaxID=3064347 RepID=A0ABT9BYF3_9PSED|nr:Lrp/AsnC family transcriptional regulator [Pseudomonas sp. K18]MDO7895874.1 Lrp/AsnC family transcriptional regulator [Pseudomonas sp. K18]